MSVITFWNNGKEQTGKTLSITAITTHMSIEHNYKILVISTGTFIPVIIVALIALRITKLDFGSVAGMMCGSMANPMALNYANDTIPGDNPAVSYATVYPLCMFLRVIIAQVILMFFI